MCLFHRLFARRKPNPHEELDTNENLQMQKSNKATVEYSEKVVADDTVEAKAPLDQQICKVREKKSTSDDNSTSEDSVRDIGPRIPKSTIKYDRGR